MARTKTQTSRERGVKSVQQFVSIKDQGGSVVGRATVTAGNDGKVWVSLQQTFGGSSEGTLNTPVKADLDVLLAICEEAEAVAESLG